MKKLTALFLALALCLSLCTVTAFAETHNLTVTKADGSAATLSNKSDGSDGNDYYWQKSGGDTWLTIFNAGLTVSGTTTSERILVKASATDLTINNLKIEHISVSGTSPLIFEGNATLTLVGDNELTCTGSAALKFDMDGKIAGAGNLTASSGSSAGIFAQGTLTFTQTGTVTASGAYGIGGRGDVSFNNGIGKILARGSSYACVSNGGAVKLGDALTMKGSTAFNTAEASITGAATIDGSYVKTNGQIALSVLIEGAKYTVTVDNTQHGTVTATPADVASGTDVTLTVTPENGYQLKSLKCEKEMTVANLLAAQNFPNAYESSNWKNNNNSGYKLYYASSPKAGTEALMAAGYEDTVGIFTTASSTLTLVNGGYKADDSAISTGNNIATFMVDENQQITSIIIEDSTNTYDGTYTPTSTLPKVNLEVSLTQQHDGTYTFTMPAANVTVTAEFEEVPHSSGGGSVSRYSVTAESAKNGTFTVDKKSAAAGSTVTVTVSPDKGFTLETITVTDKNGKEIEVKSLGNDKYSFKMPSGKVTVEVTFMEDNTMLNFCVDVTASDYYYDAVLWAYKNEICKGTDAVHFSPYAPVSRAQVVTFLWRAAGCPVVDYYMNMDDVKSGEYYSEAVRWALSEGITKGTSETAFSPDEVCTRGQIVTFLARFAGVADTDTASAFADVPADAFFAAAVKWAKDNGVTDGMTATTFEPYTNCNRAQVVTFLYRWMVK